ncbi:hypothetical protein [Amycolatopsis sp. lyj-23]|uniref:hypothetical protein n=1 Tax=Amycolatopsis sp. lyj-23 TaxID=2789283 RepID=UPI00397E10A0
MVGTIDSLSRALDVFALLGTDVRVQVMFTIEGGSAFERGLSDTLDDLGVVFVAWHEAATMTFDAVIAAEDSVGLEQLHGPVVLLPPRQHETRLLPWRFRGARFFSAGLWTAQRPMGSRELITAVDEESRRVVDADYLLVAGDPSFDRLVISVPHRRRYRQALRVGGEQRLVVVASSWGQDSLFGVHPDLPRRLLEQLPVDEFRVALVLHPHVWSAHGRWQILAWLRDALDLGLLLIEPGTEDAAIVAADVVIGDRGTLTRYAADLGSPALAAVSTHSTDPMRAFVVRHDLRQQIQAALASAVAVDVTDRQATAMRNAAATREGIYYVLRIPDAVDPPEPLPLVKPKVITGKEDQVAVTEAHITDVTRPKRPMVCAGRRPTISQVGDWVLLSPITNQAKVLYWALQAHVTGTIPEAQAWLTQESVARLLDVPENQVPAYVRELEAIDAISVARDAGETNSGWNYTVHLTPPEGYEPATSVTAFHSDRIGQD